MLAKRAFLCHITAVDVYSSQGEPQGHTAVGILARMRGKATIVQRDIGGVASKPPVDDYFPAPN
jgi:hypothetical protein